jgi:protein O-mannosyl-transferase
MYNRADEMRRAQTLAQERARSRRKPRSQSTPGTRTFLSGRNLNAVLCILLATVTIALYSPVAGHGFLNFDDADYVTANPYVHAGLRWSTIKWAFTSTAAANWHPLTWLSHALDYQFFALNPAGHHLDSVLIHSLNAIVLFLLLAWVTKRVGPSLLVAALFAFHPINVESVAWVAERKNVLSTLFLFLAICAYVRYAQRPDWRRYLLVAALFAAGLMAKPMVITLPFLLLLLDYWPLDRTLFGSTQRTVQADTSTFDDMPRIVLSKLLLEKIPLLLLSVASASITLKAQHGAVRNFEEFPLPIRIENAIVAYGMYLWKMLWPTRLAFYPHSVIALPTWQWILSALVLAAVTLLVVTFHSKRYLPVGWFWFLGTLIPVIGLVQVGEAAMADRYAYVPLIGIFVMIAFGLSDIAEAKRVRPVWLLIPALCVLTALGFATSRQITHWESDYDVWSQSLAVRENPFAHNAVGAALMEPDSQMTPHDLENFDTAQKRLDEARMHFERAMELRQQLAQQDPNRYLPYLAGSLNNLGTVDRQQNRTDEARRHFEGALKIYRQLAQQNPDAYLYYLATTLNTLGLLDRVQKQPDDARLHYEEALQDYRQLAQRNPDVYLGDMATLFNNLGNLDGQQNRLDDARRDFEAALQLYPKLAQQNPATILPNMATTLNNLANLDLIQNRTDDARRHFERALEVRRQLAQQNPNANLPDIALTLNTLGNLDRSQNRMDDSREHYEAALAAYRQLAQQDPDKYLPYVAGTLNNLGLVDSNQNRIEESRAYYQEALSVLQKLFQGNGQYAGDVARVEASLEELEKKTPSKYADL